MAKSNGDGVKKSDAIRRAIAENPAAGSKEIREILGERGIKVSSTLLYYVMSKNKQAKRKAKRARVAAATETTIARNPVEVVARVKALAREVGGLKNLKTLVDLLSE